MYVLENENRGRNKKEAEDDLLHIIKNGEFGKIEKEIKPTALECCESNALMMGMKVSLTVTLASRVATDSILGLLRKPNWQNAASLHRIICQHEKVV